MSIPKYTEFNEAKDHSSPKVVLISALHAAAKGANLVPHSGVGPSIQFDVEDTSSPLSFNVRFHCSHELVEKWTQVTLRAGADRAAPSSCMASSRLATTRATSGRNHLRLEVGAEFK